jgi:hypothetical protein
MIRRAWGMPCTLPRATGTTCSGFALLRNLAAKCEGRDAASNQLERLCAMAGELVSEVKALRLQREMAHEQLMIFTEVVQRRGLHVA